MKKLWGVVCLVAVMASVAAAQPVIRTDNGVLNASSYAADIARGSWFVIFGSGMGPATISVYSGALPYPTTLSGTSVSFTPASGGAAVSARLWYTLAGQLAGLLPSTAAAGDYDVKVTYNGSTGAAKRVKVVERNFGYATQAQNGSGPAQATYGGLDLNRFTTGKLAQWSLRPAKAGDTMVLWGTGLGADPNSDLDGSTSGDQKDAGAVKVVVGGIEVTPLYAGRSGGSPGLDQINFTVPASAAPGCFVSLAVKAGGRTSNLGSIAIAEAGKAACMHPSYTESQMSRLDQGGTLTIGSLTLSKITTKSSFAGQSFDMMSESASGSFGRYGVAAVATSGFSMTQIGACYVYRFVGTTDEIAQGAAPVPLDAGAQLTLNGPNASNKAVPRVAGEKVYNLALYSSGYGGFGGSGTPTLAQGTYTLAGTGGPDVGAFSASLDVPGAFVWTNEGSLANPIPRSTNMPITWTGGGSGLVAITGTAMSQTGGTETNPIYDQSGFSCVAQASAGSFTVPSSVLQQLPAVSADISTGSIGNLMVFAVSDASKGQGIFPAPLTAGGTIDQGYMSYSIGTSKSTGWQ
jgi:uncharacterized protein (TIGR03437 family)